MEETVKRVTPRISLRSVLHQQVVFERGEVSEFFQVPEPRRKLGIFPNPRAYMEETVTRVKPRTSLRQLAVFGGGGRTGIFLSARAYMKRESS